MSGMTCNMVLPHCLLLNARGF